MLIDVFYVDLKNKEIIRIGIKFTFERQNLDMEIKPVSLTAIAAVEVKRIMENKGIPEDYGLRIGVKGGVAVVQVWALC